MAHLCEVTAQRTTRMEYRSASIRDRVQPEQLLFAAIVLRGLIEHDRAYIRGPLFSQHCGLAGIDASRMLALSPLDATVVYRRLMFPLTFDSPRSAASDD